MDMITEDYVSFETAKLLNEKGLYAHTEHNMWYVVEEFSTGCHWNSCTYKVGDITREYDKKYCITMPTLQMAMKWLRKVHNLHCAVDYDIVLGWYCQITNLKETVEYDYEEMKHYHPDKDNGFSSPEEAYEAAIKYCLEHKICN